MTVLDQILNMKKMGMLENEIVKNLREQGISPKEISDAINQSKIKEAVNSEAEEEFVPSIMRPEKAESLPTEGEIREEDLLPQKPIGNSKIHVIRKELSEEGPWPAQEEQQEEIQEQPPEQEYYEQQEMPPEPYSYYYAEPTPSMHGIPIDTNTIIEISEQVFSEKIKNLQKQLDSLNEFRVISQTKIENMSERLKRIEASLDDLQSEILEKIGNYGSGIDSIKKEMEIMQDSFGKIASFVGEKSYKPKKKKS